eukprot:SAG31_NODE_359_length_17032_cov_11.017894_18_plen_49_part_00
MVQWLWGAVKRRMEERGRRVAESYDKESPNLMTCYDRVRALCVLACNR